jgi:hypothetical protein
MLLHWLAKHYDTFAECKVKRVLYVAPSTHEQRAKCRPSSFPMRPAICQQQETIRYTNSADNYFIRIRRRTVYRNTLYYGQYNILFIPKYTHTVSIHIKLTIALLGKWNANVFVCAQSSILFTGFITTETSRNSVVSKFVRLIHTFYE